MNKRIRELAQQAEILITVAGAFHNTPQGAYQLQEQHMNKFAELLVRECAGIYDKIDNGNLHMGTDNYLEALQKHFGVEE